MNSNRRPTSSHLNQATLESFALWLVFQNERFPSHIAGRTTAATSPAVPFRRREQRLKLRAGFKQESLTELRTLQPVEIKNCQRIPKMNRCDQELLDKQLKHFEPPPRRDGLMMLAVVGVFLAGMTAGSLLFAYRSPPAVQTASSDGTTALAFFLNGMPAIAR
jgi:hypothetical protein